MSDFFPVSLSGLQGFRDSKSQSLLIVFTKAFAFQEFVILPFEPFVAKTFGGREFCSVSLFEKVTLSGLDLLLNNSHYIH